MAAAAALCRPPLLSPHHQWDELKREIRRSPEFRFDWIFKSRTPQELSRRVDLLIRLVMNEAKEGGQAGRGATAKRASDGTGSAGPAAKVAKEDSGAAGSVAAK